MSDDNSLEISQLEVDIFERESFISGHESEIQRCQDQINGYEMSANDIAIRRDVLADELNHAREELQVLKDILSSLG